MTPEQRAHLDAELAATAASLSTTLDLVDDLRLWLDNQPEPPPTHQPDREPRHP